MIKNIQGHKNFMVALLITTSATLFSRPEITIKDLAPQSIEQLYAFAKTNPGPCTINLVPDQGVWGTVSTSLATPFIALRKSMNFKNISLTVISGALSLGWISYLLCAYIIYKTYLALQNVHSWTNFCSNDDLLSDYDAFYRNYKRRSRKQPSGMTLQQEKELLATYLRLDAFLRMHKLRHYFPHGGMLTQTRIKDAFTKLEKMKELLTIRKQRMHFARNL